jgi:hypothetical protein
MSFLPVGFEIEQLGQAWPDEPLPNIAGFDRLSEVDDPDTISRLAAWIERQQACTMINKWHGPAGLRRVLVAIARSAVRLHVPLGPRLLSVAQYEGLVG